MISSIIASLRSRSRRQLIENLALHDLSPEEFVRLAYLLLLKRQIDPTGLSVWRGAIARNMFNHDDVIRAIQSSDEYQSKSSGAANERLHLARQEWVRSLPAFDRLLDIGGSSPNQPEGALIQMGYPHRPSTLHILDLPPERQNWGTPSYDQSAPLRFDWGVVTYFHGRAETIAEVAGMQDETYDCVFMGQAIEHVHPHALPGVLDWIRRHLRPSGRFVIDTPNRLLTKIQCPTWFIHPDHQIEYEPAQLEQIFAASGFKVVKRTGMVHLPRIARSGNFDMRDFRQAPLLHDSVEECYLFALDATLAG